MSIDPHAIFPDITLSDRAALALAAWQALLASGHASPHSAPREAYEAAGWMLKEMTEREGWRT